MGKLPKTVPSENSIIQKKKANSSSFGSISFDQDPIQQQLHLLVKYQFATTTEDSDESEVSEDHETDREERSDKSLEDSKKSDDEGGSHSDFDSDLSDDGHSRGNNESHKLKKSEIEALKKKIDGHAFGLYAQFDATPSQTPNRTEETLTPKTPTENTPRHFTTNDGYVLPCSDQTPVTTSQVSSEKSTYSRSLPTNLQNIYPNCEEIDKKHKLTISQPITHSKSGRKYPTVSPPTLQSNLKGTVDSQMFSERLNQGRNTPTKPNQTSPSTPSRKPLREETESPITLNISAHSIKSDGYVVQETTSTRKQSTSSSRPLSPQEGRQKRSTHKRRSNLSFENSEQISLSTTHPYTPPQVLNFEGYVIPPESATHQQIPSKKDLNTKLSFSPPKNSEVQEINPTTGISSSLPVNLDGYVLAPSAQVQSNHQTVQTESLKVPHLSPPSENKKFGHTGGISSSSSPSSFNHINTTELSYTSPSFPNTAQSTDSVVKIHKTKSKKKVKSKKSFDPKTAVASINRSEREPRLLNPKIHSSSTIFGKSFQVGESPGGDIKSQQGAFPLPVPDVSLVLDDWNIRFQRCVRQLNDLNSLCTLEERTNANSMLMHLSEGKICIISFHFFHFVLFGFSLNFFIFFIFISHLFLFSIIVSFPS
jgi:hypothetical protein